MNRVIALRETELVTVARFDHPPKEEHRDPAEELCTDYCVSFVESGHFAMLRGRKTHELGIGSAILTHPGLAFRCRHHQECPDDVCLCLSFRDNLSVEETLFGAHRPVRRKRGDFVRQAGNRLAYLQLRLAKLLQVNSAPDDLALDELAAELVIEAHAPVDEFPRGRYTGSQLAWYTERIEAVRQILNQRSTLPHSLASLARIVHMSPFHFARVFRSLVGKPPHRYLLEVRLKRAAELLRGGLTVTDACYDSGFNNLSYFTRRFRRRFGKPPSEFVN
jgi:AraC family transcriptional regulator